MLIVKRESPERFCYALELSSDPPIPLGHHATWRWGKERRREEQREGKRKEEKKEGGSEIPSLVVGLKLA